MLVHLLREGASANVGTKYGGVPLMPGSRQTQQFVRRALCWGEVGLVHQFPHAQRLVCMVLLLHGCGCILHELPAEVFLMMLTFVPNWDICLHS